MCSLCGGNYSLDVVVAASATMRHRGKDAQGSFEDKKYPSGSFCLAHNRLSIIDLGEEANQPFISPFCPDLVLVYNGEIYNYLEIKQELQKQEIPFYTTSDTEVLLHAYVFWGRECLKYLNGDFAFAIYHKNTKELFLARDRIGNKPLFYYHKNGRFFFASEIKALLKLKGFDSHFSGEFDLQEVATWLLFSSGHTNQTIYKDIQSFPAGHYAIFKEDSLRMYSYWDFNPKDFLESPITSLESALEEIDFLLLDSTKIRLRSNVPVALSVSGGIDSSLIAHYVCKLQGDCRFFGVSFPGFKESDESIHILQLQQDLDVQVQQITPHMQEITKYFQKLVYVQDEIFRSLSVYAQFLLFQSLAPYCKVALGGQGADELFGGYYHHIGRFIFANPHEFENRIMLYGVEALKEYAFGLKCSLKDSLKSKLFEEDNARDICKLKASNLPIPSFDFLLERFLLDFNQSLWLDTKAYNLPNLLRYEDRNAMACGVENRTPFTDYRIVEFAFKIVPNLKFAQGYSKYLLRVLLERLGSKTLAWRTDKVGFAAPEMDLMQTLNFPCQSLFDVRMAIFQTLKQLRKDRYDMD